jgi:molecular chaperone GrpE
MKKNDEELQSEEIIEAAEEAPTEIDYQVLYQRSLADLENMRRRFEDERKLVSKLAIGDLVIDLLPVLDNFTRATEHVPETEKNSAWATGILYIRKQLMDVLNERGVQELHAQVGDSFDPSLHEALDSVHNSDQPDDSIAEVKSQGYKLHDKIMRPVQVIVNTHN